MTKGLAITAAVLLVSNVISLLWLKLVLSQVKRKLNNAKGKIQELGHGIEERDEAITLLEKDLVRYGKAGIIANDEVARLRASVARCREPTVVKSRLDAALLALQDP